MSRLKNFSRNLTTSYLQLGVNTAYTLASVPLILHWLTMAEYGVWTVVLAFANYFTLVDLGVNQAVSRFLVDHKDQRHTGQYGALIKTAILVSLVQGLIVLAVMTLGAPAVAGLMKVHWAAVNTFIRLMWMQGLLSAFIFCMNPLTMILYAHQRMDVPARQSMFGMIVGFGLMALFLKNGLGVYSFVYANAIVAMVGPVHYLWHCRRMRLFPAAGEWGKISWPQFKGLFLYGKDIFLMNLGAQLITMSQVPIIFRVFGEHMSGVYGISTKVFLMIRQLVWQPFAAALPGLFEMLARNEAERLRARFQSMVSLTASLGAFLGISFVLCNSLFVTVWTSLPVDHAGWQSLINSLFVKGWTDKGIHWLPMSDVLLAAWMLFSAFQAPHCNFVMVTKRIGGMRYIYFVEGCCFVALSLGVGYRWGIPGILFCSTACVIGFSYLYGLWRSGRYFHLGFYELAVNWVRPAWKLAIVYTLVAGATWLLTSGLPVFWRLVVHAAVAALAGGLLLVRIGLPHEVVQEAGRRLPQPVSILLKALTARKGWI